MGECFEPDLQESADGMEPLGRVRHDETRSQAKVGGEEVERDERITQRTG
jgi:hypothetical protein